eukprot:TRINITY_DN2878_c0_g1_i1.p1 TRINITY_DN2878_c0_g1~~TRINITY_DN2878_c0_g1_i1.p1  ORF type:complete len:253 (-),score=68.52 TRINITY_DN2878_c0_g1_i1:268-1026(-)
MGSSEVLDMSESLSSIDLPPDVSLEWSGMEIRAKILGTESFYRLFPNPSSKLTSNGESIHNRKKSITNKKRKRGKIESCTLSSIIGEKDVISMEPGSGKFGSTEGERTKKCHICGKGFYKLVYLKRHIISHSNSKPIRCEVCGWGFFQRENLEKHMETHHNRSGEGENKASPPPPRGIEEGGDKPLLQPPKGSKKWECKVCGKKFLKHQIYQNHLTLHRNSKLFSCNICNRRFRDEFIWKKHTQLHHLKKKT